VLAGPTTGTATTPSFRSLVSADIPNNAANTTGTAANVTGTVAITNGGTGQTTQQAAINALTGTQAAGEYLRSDGTNASLSSIQVLDLPGYDVEKYLIVSDALTYIVPDNCSRVILDYATPTLYMPVNPVNGQILKLSVCTVAASTLNLFTSGTQTITGTPPSSIGLYSAVEFIYNASGNTWYRIS
jgi:hypothetical protein